MRPIILNFLRNFCWNIKIYFYQDQTDTKHLWLRFKHYITFVPMRCGLVIFSDEVGAFLRSEIDFQKSRVLPPVLWYCSLIRRSKCFDRTWNTVFKIFIPKLKIHTSELWSSWFFRTIKWFFGIWKEYKKSVRFNFSYLIWCNTIWKINRISWSFSGSFDWFRLTNNLGIDNTI